MSGVRKNRAFAAMSTKACVSIGVSYETTVPKRSGGSPQAQNGRMRAAVLGLCSF